MTDVFSKKKRSDIMSRIGSKNTKPEIALRKSLHRLGYRFRLHVNALPGKPDIVLPKYQIAIQVRGCFWHGHNCIDGHLPKTNKEYWANKLLDNRTRDRVNDRLLRKGGWTLIVVWECSLNTFNGRRKQVERICGVIQKRKAAWLM